MPHGSSLPNITARAPSAQRGAVSANHDIVEHGFNVPSRVCTHPTPASQRWPKKTPKWESVLVTEREIVRAARTTSEVLAIADHIGAQHARDPQCECFAVKRCEVSRVHQPKAESRNPEDASGRCCGLQQRAETCASELHHARVITCIRHACTSGSHTECGRNRLLATSED